MISKKVLIYKENEIDLNMQMIGEDFHLQLYFKELLNLKYSIPLYEITFRITFE